MKAEKITFVSKAEAAWGEALPVEVLTLAEWADASTASAIAKRLGVSPATFSHLIGRKVENHDLGKLFGLIRGALLGETLECPIKGTMSRNTCLKWQGKPFAPTSADRVRMFHACRSACPHSRLKGA